MLNKLLKVRQPPLTKYTYYWSKLYPFRSQDPTKGRHADIVYLVIARNALAQEESEEFSGDFSDPINIHIENDRDGCAC
jgi:hypothetical protein